MYIRNNKSNICQNIYVEDVEQEDLITATKRAPQIQETKKQ